LKVLNSKKQKVVGVEENKKLKKIYIRVPAWWCRRIGRPAAARTLLTLPDSGWEGRTPPCSSWISRERSERIERREK